MIYHSQWGQGGRFGQRSAGPAGMEVNTHRRAAEEPLPPRPGNPIHSSAHQPLAARPAQPSQSPAPPPTAHYRSPGPPSKASPFQGHSHRRLTRLRVSARCVRTPPVHGWIASVGADFQFRGHQPLAASEFSRGRGDCGVGLGVAGGATMATAPAHVAGPTYSLKSTLAFSSFDSSRVNSKGFSACTSLSIHRNGRVRAGLEGESSVSQHKESASRPVLRRKKPVPSPGNMTLGAEDSASLETLLVEDERVSLEGVGRVDREAPSSSFSWGRAGILVAGDLVALITFAFIGRYSHGLTSLNWDAVRTADPFIAGWLLGSYFLGGYGTDGQGMNGVSRAATSALKSWAVGVPLGLVIRGIVTSHVPAQAFILVSLGSLLVLMVGWRVAFVYVFASGGNTVEKRPGNRSGGIFEFIELLTSLVRRW